MQTSDKFNPVALLESSFTVVLTSTVHDSIKAQELNGCSVVVGAGYTKSVLTLLFEVLMAKKIFLPFV